MVEDGGQRITMSAAELDAGLARREFDGARAWLQEARSQQTAEPLAAEVWAVDEAVENVVLVRHRWRGWVCPGGRVEDGETPRFAAARELFEETGLVASLDSVPAAVFVRSYRSDWTPTLGLAYTTVIPGDSEVKGEYGQAASWVPLAQAWVGAFPEDVDRIREYARLLKGAARPDPEMPLAGR